MPLLPTPTTLQLAVLKSAEAAHHCASVIRAGWESYWQRDPDTILAEMQADMTATLTAFSLNTQAATAINALLDAVDDGRFTARAPSSMPTGWSYSPQTGFTYTPPAPPTEPEP